MMTLAIAITGFILSGLITIFTLHPGAGLLRRAFGEDKCLEENSINGCNWWPWAQIISAGLVAWNAGTWGWWALTLSLSGPLAMLLLAGLALRFHGLRHLAFFWKDGHVELKDGRRVQPSIVVNGGGYSCTGPGSGYVVYALALYEGTQRLAANTYVSERECNEMVGKLFSAGCVSLSLVIWRDVAPLKYESAHFSPPWTVAVCTALATMPPEDRAWWNQWIQPAFTGEREVATAEVRNHVTRFVESMRPSVESDDTIATDHASIMELLRRAGPTIVLMTSDRSMEKSEAMRNGGLTEISIDEGVWVHTIMPASGSDTRS